MHVNDILLRHDLQAISQRLYRRVDWSGGPLSCWPWLGRTKKGYGHMSIGAHEYRVLTHRLSYVLANGPLPPDVDGKYACVLHHCDNPPCCNPAHLFVGSNRHNIDDMLAKGRSAKGEDSGRAKLTEEQVLAIISSRGTALALAAKYDVAPGTIADIRQRKSWRHLGRLEPVMVGPRRGEESTHAKLTDEKVRAIRLDPRPRPVLAAEYDVSTYTIRAVKRRKAWKHVV